ncbi:MAG TPA: hypothetical protein DCP49_06100 [Erysipelotrichaceae bacterium]|nr:hypothetical protein [Erysipelotrichaceae bacterium]
MKRRKIRKGRLMLAACVVLLLVSGTGWGIHALFSSAKKEKVADEKETPGTEETALITATGDLLLEDGFVNTFGKGSWNDYMSDLSPWFARDDWTLANLEVPIAGEELGLAGADYCFNAPAQTAGNLKNNSIEYVTLANNHAMDRGVEGLEKTIGHLDENGIGHTGAFLSEEDRDTVSFANVNGIRIAIVSWTYQTNQAADTDWRVNQFYDASSSMIPVLMDDIARARQESDCVIVCMHWGTEFTYELNEAQTILSQQIADAGADVIVGNHPHTIQPAAWLTGMNGNRTLCFYSLGNLISSAYMVDRADETFQDMYEVGAIAQFRLKKTKDGSVAVLDPHIIPIVNHFEGEYTNFHIYPLKEYTEELAAVHSQRQYSDLFTKQWLQDQVEGVFSGSGIPVVLE